MFLFFFLNATAKRAYVCMHTFLKSTRIDMKIGKALGPDRLWYFELEFYTVFCF